MEKKAIFPTSRRSLRLPTFLREKTGEESASPKRLTQEH